LLALVLHLMQLHPPSAFYYLFLELLVLGLVILVAA
jgi:hypothetical protein